MLVNDSGNVIVLRLVHLLKLHLLKSVIELGSSTVCKLDKGNLTDEEWKEVWSAMQKTNKYLRAIGAPESEMYDI